MLIQESISTPDPLLKLAVAIEADLNVLQPRLQANHLPRDPRGGAPTLSAAEVLTILVWGGLAGTDGQGQSVLSRPDVSSQRVPDAGGGS
jgi:hypothetical protein